MKIFVCGSCDTVRNDRMFMVRSGRSVRLVDTCSLCRDPSVPKRRCPECKEVTAATDFLLFHEGIPPTRRRTCTKCRLASGDRETRELTADVPPRAERVIDELVVNAPTPSPVVKESIWSALKPAWLKHWLS